MLVTGDIDQRGARAHAGVDAPYLRALSMQGVPTLVASPLSPLALAPRLLDGMAGLLLTGGEDIDPAMARDRDQLELALFHEARSRGLPVLAICRGMQLVNVALGGTLWQDLPSERPSAVGHAPDVPREQRTHAVQVVAGSALARALGCGELAVNSAHHQGLRELGPGVVPVASSDDGLVEAIETHAGPWMVGVQWHPEDLVGVDRGAPEAGLFQAFAQALSARPVAA